MKYDIAKKQISHYETAGDCTGDWVSESRYIYKIHNPYPENAAFVFETHSRINLEFTNGGSVDLIVTVHFICSEFGSKPMLMQMMELAKVSFELAKEMFFDFIEFTGDKEKVWVHWTDKELALDLAEKMTAAFTQK